MIDFISHPDNQKGQIVIIALLVMVITLAVALSIVGRSVTEMSTSTKTEDSSRAFSAAEAGIEKAIRDSLDGGDPNTFNASRGDLSLGNLSEADASWNPLLPKEHTALEYDAFGKESFAQFWLADPETLARYYNQDTFELYFGVPKDYSVDVNTQQEQPAVEVNVIVKTSTGYQSRRYNFDSWAVNPATGRNDNRFRGCDSPPGKNTGTNIHIKTNDYLTDNRYFYCKATVRYRNGAPGNPYAGADEANVYPIMARVRILYTNMKHPVALQPVGNCGRECSLPFQVTIYRSKGTAGTTQRILRVFRQRDVMPYFFDYVLFSASTLEK